MKPCPKCDRPVQDNERLCPECEKKQSEEVIEGFLNLMDAPFDHAARLRAMRLMEAGRIPTLN
jgi:RNA polymerase subunit RPABC4/transcription elongation factor Spt4